LYVEVLDVIQPLSIKVKFSHYFVLHIARAHTDYLLKEQIMETRVTRSISDEEVLT